MGFPIKTLNFLKMARGIKFAIESNWKSKITQNVQTFGCYKTIYKGCEIKFYFNLNWNCQFSQKLQNIWASL